MYRVGQNRKCAPYTVIYGVYIRFWPTLYIYTVYTFVCMVLANPTIIRTYTVYVHVGLARTIYIWCVYGFFGREITRYTVIYGVYIRFWPTLCIRV